MTASAQHNNSLDASRTSELLIDNLRVTQLRAAASTLTLDGFLMSSRTPKLKRRLAFVLCSIAVLLFATLFVLWYFPGLTFRMVSVADGRNSWAQQGQTVLFIRVSENMVSYRSEAEARQAFESDVARAETILERTKHPTSLPYVDEQVVGTFILSNERYYSILRLEKADVYQTYAPSLHYALAFDKFRRPRLALRSE